MVVMYSCFSFNGTDVLTFLYKLWIGDSVAVSFSLSCLYGNICIMSDGRKYVYVSY